ncbi:PREDICTED: uncharacterized protein LOC106816733 [Priapulus caudatus]|uniref:Uncharacterized protein LOC106816733 n=1 Tax=Priapulus caudatus TaxID=37621 RepID=A0ABM1EXB5_PRICU|nr:PREDICTED: uncharacterized protein LOC106816733 [Priapulus caudatus]
MHSGMQLSKPPSKCKIMESDSEMSLPLFVPSRDEAVTVKKAFELKSGINYCRFRAYVGKEEITPRSIHFLDSSGVVKENEHPFIVVKTDTYECMYGRDRHAARKLKGQAKDEERMIEDHPMPLKRTYRNCQASRKKGCPATMVFKEVILFTDYKINNTASEWKKRQMSKVIRSALDNGAVELTQEHRVYIKYPTEEAHQSVHELGPRSSLKTAGQTNILEEAYSNGMIAKNTACAAQICRAGQETGLSVKVVENWIGNKKRALSGKSCPRPHKVTTAHQSGFNLFCKGNGKQSLQEWGKKSKNLSQNERTQFNEAAMSRRTSLSDEEKAAKVKQLHGHMYKTMKELECLGAETIVIGTQLEKREAPFLCSSRKGLSYLKDHPLFVQEICLHLESEHQTAECTQKTTRTTALLRKHVQTLFNDKYSHASGKPMARLPYKLVDAGVIGCEGLPPGVLLKRPSNYGHRCLERILVESETIKFVIHPHDATVSDAADIIHPYDASGAATTSQ